MSSELRVDRIIPTTGVPTGGGGGIIQIVEGNTDNRVETSSSTFVATNLSATITPRFASSKIFIMTGGDTNTNDPGNNQYLTYYRSINSGTFTNIAPNGSNDSAAANANRGLVNVYGGDSRIHVPMFMGAIDSPSTTSSVEYKVYIRAGSGTVEFPSQDGYNAARIFLMEVSG